MPDYEQMLRDSLNEFLRNGQDEVALRIISEVFQQAAEFCYTEDPSERQAYSNYIRIANIVKCL